jgi:hypothetical protein
MTSNDLYNFRYSESGKLLWAMRSSSRKAVFQMNPAVSEIRPEKLDTTKMLCIIDPLSHPFESFPSEPL